MQRWVTYKNGNYTVKLNTQNGTKIRENNCDCFIPYTVESMDIKITNRCDRGCTMCHENSTIDGKHADLRSPSFLDVLHPYTELAIGGGNPLEHPDLEWFLQKCKEKQFIPSMTVNQYHFEKEFVRIKKLYDEKLIYGLGISLVNPTTDFIEKVKQIPTAVIHIIAGLVSDKQLYALRNNGLKILVLGYKKVRRGSDLYDKQGVLVDIGINNLHKLLPKMMYENWFEVISFDNLALNQLNVKDIVGEEVFNEHYMGDDGFDGDMTSASMFVDMVERVYAKNSCDMTRYPIKDTIEEMYNSLRKYNILGVDLARGSDFTVDNKVFLEDLRLEQLEQM